MDIKLPGLTEQKEIVKQKQKKIRTSFELTEESLELLEGYAKELDCPPSEVFKTIVEETHLDTAKLKKRLKNVTIFQVHMDKLQQIAEELIPEKNKGKRGPNKNFVAEMMVQEFFARKNG